MLRFACVVALLSSSIAFAHCTAPAPAAEKKPYSSLQDAADAFEDTGPGKLQPTLTTPTTPTTPALPVPQTTIDLPEANAVDGWTVTALVSGRRRPDGTPSAEACGYERDVTVTRAMPEAATTSAVLVVGCDVGSAGVPVASSPVLRLPPPWGPAPGAVVVSDDLEVGVK